MIEFTFNLSDYPIDYEAVLERHGTWASEVAEERLSDAKSDLIDAICAVEAGDNFDLGDLIDELRAAASEVILDYEDHYAEGLVESEAGLSDLEDLEEVDGTRSQGWDCVEYHTLYLQRESGRYRLIARFHRDAFPCGNRHERDVWDVVKDWSPILADD